MGKVQTKRWPLLVLAATVLAGGCSRQDTDRLAKIGRILSSRAEKAMDALKEDLTEEWNAIEKQQGNNQALHRVIERLQATKDLADAQIEVTARGEVIELKGQVKDLVQKRRAVQMAESTPGVTKVEDYLRMKN
jgi:hypothetical protein